VRFAADIQRLSPRARSFYRRCLVYSSPTWILSRSSSPWTGYFVRLSQFSSASHRGRPARCRWASACQRPSRKDSVETRWPWSLLRTLICCQSVGSGSSPPVRNSSWRSQSRRSSQFRTVPEANWWAPLWSTLRRNSRFLWRAYRSSRTNGPCTDGSEGVALRSSWT